MFDPNELRVVVSIDENKGFSDIALGDRAEFTVDAFGGKKYSGYVSDIAPSAHQNDVVFSISDKRQTQQFDVKIAFDPAEYPEILNGMSAKVWIYKGTANGAQ